MPKHKCYLLLVLLLGVAGPAFSQLLQVQGRQYAIVHDLEADLLVYDDDVESYLPYVRGTPFLSNAATFWLPLHQYQSYLLLIGAPPEASLLINQNVVAHYPQGGSYVYPVDSLRSLYGDSCLVTLYRYPLSLPEVQLAVVGQQSLPVTESHVGEQFLKVQERPSRNFDNFFVIALVLILAGLAMLRNLFPRVFSSYYSLGEVLSDRMPNSSSAFAYKLGGPGQLLFIVVYSALFAFLLLVLLHAAGYWPELGWLGTDPGFGAYLWSWLRLVALVLLLQLIKYFMLQIMAGIFNFQEFASVHYFDFLRISQMFFSMLLAAVAVVFLSLPMQVSAGASLLLKVVLIFALLRIGLIFFKLMQLANFRKTYLFSYLCATEILPLLVGLKLLID
ncbi:DUF4271 domain-containing protein [Cesiribacter andamanensis]|uniref:DUF4271 domain-containing protein n=1 Tax=Cesiribacter andamanensis AMV16 TaxID=1279009 RepID=M7N5A2_9BACT|nr:DUF4271 domain-containing protein [Cesiribacter andamanensis]EMR03788.1 hypothetical protein ADICEAN_01029 [Cesiribacter andamanensis AMV16]